MTRVKPSMLPPTIITAPTSDTARPKAVMPTVSSANRSSHSSRAARCQRLAPSDCHCSPWARSASSMAWRVRAVTTGTTSTVCATTIAWKLNIQPRKPSGPERDSSRYTTSPTTTDGSANRVLRPASTSPRPLNRDTASQAPSHSPRPQANTQAVALTASDRRTTLHSTASPDVTSCNAVQMLSVNPVMRGSGPCGRWIVAQTKAGTAAWIAAEKKQLAQKKPVEMKLGNAATYPAKPPCSQWLATLNVRGRKRVES